MRRALLTALLIFAALAPDGATAATRHADVIGILVPKTGKFVRSVDIPYTATGGLAVSFHGDPAAGCARLGVCDYAGSLTAIVGSGDLFTVTTRAGRRTTMTSVFAGDDQTSAVVTRTPASGSGGRCTDDVEPGSLGAAQTGHGHVTLRLLDRRTAVLATRCAGPIDADVAAASPTLQLSAAQASHGSGTLRFTGERTFSAGGYSGTVQSTVVLHLGRPRPSETTIPRGISRMRMRTVRFHLMPTGVTGRLEAHVRGVAEPTLCALLDSCGLHETVTIAPRLRSGTGEIDVTSPARLPLSRSLATLGLAAGRGGLGAEGFVSWGGPGRATLAMTQDGAGCRASAPAPGGTASLSVSGGRLVVTLLEDGDPRSACPGPFLTTPDGGVDLATGSVPLSALRHRTFAVRLRAAGPTADDGYAIHMTGSLTLRLRRGRTTQDLVEVPGARRGA